MKQNYIFTHSGVLEILDKIVFSNVFDKNLEIYFSDILMQKT